MDTELIHRHRSNSKDNFYLKDLQSKWTDIDKSEPILLKIDPHFVEHKINVAKFLNSLISEKNSEDLLPTADYQESVKLVLYCMYWESCMIRVFPDKLGRLNHSS